MKIRESDKWGLAEGTTSRRDEKAMEVLRMLIERDSAETMLVTDADAPKKLAAIAYRIAEAMRAESGERFKADLDALDKALEEASAT